MYKNPTKSPGLSLSTNLTDKLRSVTLFSSLPDKVLQQIVMNCDHCIVNGGQVLIQENEVADELFIVLQGRFTVVKSGKPVAEILAGEPIGEIAFLSGSRRTANVVAARRSEVLVLTQHSYHQLARTIPELSQFIIMSLAKRLEIATRSSPGIKSRLASITALVPIGKGQLIEKFQAKLSACMQDEKDWYLLDSHSLSKHDNPMQFISNLESKIDKLLFSTDPLQHPEVSKIMLDNADSVFFITDAQAPEDSLSDIENQFITEFSKTSQQLLIVREHSSVKIKHTARHLKKCPVDLHHHIALDNQADFSRLLRFLSGSALGLVLCGGGAFGTAHLGMIKALHEYGYQFDLVGGTSVGAALSGAYAMGLTPDEILQKANNMFIKSGAMKRLTVPIFSILEHHHFDAELKRNYMETAIEDLPINFFAVATSLTHNDMRVIRRGPLWRAIRASSSIPALLPPVLENDGEVLIDGALIDNTPLETMRQIKPGPNVVMNITQVPGWRIHSSYEKIPGRLGSMKRMLFPWVKNRPYIPSIFSVLSRTMVVNAERRFAELKKHDDIFLETKRLPKMGFMDWHKGQQQFEMSYSQLSRALEAASQKHHNTELGILETASLNLQYDSSS